MTLRTSVFGLTLTSVIALASLSANAADMYRSAPGGYKDGPVYAPVATWTGFYAGVNGGYGWSNSDNNSLSPEGGFGGGQIGYNWQGGLGFGPSFVLGVETDIQGSGIEDKAFGDKSSLNWFGTVRGRLGYAFGPTMIYGTGGFAYGEVENSSAGFSKTDTQTGWVAGGGIEHKFNPSWSVKAEYQFISLDSDDSKKFRSSDDNLEINTVRVGLNYHFGHGYEPLK